MRNQRGFTLIEMIIVIAIIAILATVSLLYLSPARGKASDTKRKAEISQLGRFLTISCYTPEAGEGEYDLASIAEELMERYSSASRSIGISQIPRDPRASAGGDFLYKYAVLTIDGKKRCALYANLESPSEPVTLPHLSAPTPGGGTGVLRASENGWNNTPLYFQVSN